MISEYSSLKALNQATARSAAGSVPVNQPSKLLNTETRTLPAIGLPPRFRSSLSVQAQGPINELSCGNTPDLCPCMSPVSVTEPPSRLARRALLPNHRDVRHRRVSGGALVEQQRRLSAGRYRRNRRPSGPDVARA